MKVGWRSERRKGEKEMKRAGIKESRGRNRIINRAPINGGGR